MLKFRVLTTNSAGEENLYNLTTNEPPTSDASSGLLVFHDVRIDNGPNHGATVKFRAFSLANVVFYEKTN